MGVIVIIFSLTIVVASTRINSVIGVKLNSVNVSIDDVKVANKGQDYSLDNSKSVPFSILYEGTTYLPVRKLSEIIGIDIGWNSDTETIELEVNGLKDVKDTTSVKEETQEKDIVVDKTVSHSSGIKLTPSYRIISNNSVGNEWNMRISYGDEYGDTYSPLEIDSPNGDITIEVVVYEHDDEKSDFGTVEITIPEEDILSGDRIVYSDTMTIMEDGGRYSGNTAEVEYTVVLSH